MGGKVKVALGTENNSPVIDTGTLSKSTMRSPVPLGMSSHTTRSKKRAQGNKAKTGPKGYVIVNNIKNMLPNQTWEQARTRINELFRNAGGLQVVYVKSTESLPQLNLTDGVIECYLDNSNATLGFKSNVSSRLNTLGGRLFELRSLAKKFNQHDHYSVKNAGRSYTVKGIFQESPYLPRLVCITYGVIVVTIAFAVWGGLLEKKTKTTLATIGRAPLSEQLGFGIVLGNLIAHELRHQLSLSKTGVGLDHSGSGLGMDGADFKNSQIKFSDEVEIKNNLTSLRRVQVNYEFSLL